MITVREALPEDINDVYSIACECFNHPWSADMLLQEIRKDRSIVVVAEVDGEVVGFAALAVMFDEGHITNVAVKKDHRKKGVASMMMKSLMQLSEKFPLCMLTLEVRISNVDAINLYKSKGFVIVGARANYYNDTNEDALIMSIFYEVENE
ncbi:MAG: ribosomal protein S18-alanine N-acetyltransferase [Eubacteriaceae bacterium]|nr:ribosomal protein S18-alanine N-acetyltransferase [Eubacteriaceae bacterium]